MEDIGLAYFAGLFDGEGCISIGHHKPQRGKRTEQHTLRCSVVMTDKKCVTSFIVFGGSICQKTKFLTNPKWQPQWTWSISSNQAKGFLETFLPFLRLKKKQAQLAIEFQEMRSRPLAHNKVSKEEISKRNWYWQRLKELKWEHSDD